MARKLGCWNPLKPKPVSWWGSAPVRIRSDATTAAGYYRDLLSQSRQQRSVATIQSGSERQATEMMRELFKLASEAQLDISLFTDRLTQSVFDPLVDELAEFLGAGNIDQTEPRIRVLVEDDLSRMTDNRFYQTLVAWPRKAAIERVLQTAKPSAHFLLVGIDAYWVETNHDTFEADGCFADPGKVVTVLLQDRFDTAWQAARAAH